MPDFHITAPPLQWLRAEAGPPETGNVTEADKGDFGDPERVLAKRISGTYKPDSTEIHEPRYTPIWTTPKMCS